MAGLFLWQEAPLQVTRAGTWLHGEEPLHPRVQRLFAQHLAWSQAAGYQIVIGRDRQPLAVDDTALHVLACHPVVGVDGALVAAEVVLSDGAKEALDLGRLHQAADLVLYTEVARGALWLPCRFLPGAYYALALALDLDAAGRLVANGRPLPLGAGRPEERIRA